MSLTEDFCVDVEVEDIEITIDEETPEVDVIITSSPDVIILAAANIGGEGATGPQGPAGATGPVGPAGPAGADGAPGTPGSAGTPGEKWFSGSGAPSGATGVVGDWYLNTANGDVYEKTGSSTWTLRANIMGPAGSSVASGVSSTATGDVAATNVQAAIAELASEKQAVSAKGAANGYAPLDASSKVPVANLPSSFTIVDAAEDLIVGSANDTVKRLAKGTDGQVLKIASGAVAWGDLAAGGGVDYIGDWSAGVSYNRGDVARYQGVDYLAVNPSTGQVPSPSIPMFGGIGTSFPASPVNGMEYILVDSLSTPSYSWRFRYSTDISDAYKWIFIGGVNAVVLVDTAETSASTTYVDLATVGPQFPAPRSGIYVVELVVPVTTNGTNQAYVGLKIGSAAIAATDERILQSGATTSGVISLVRKIIAASSDMLKLQYKVNTGAAATWQNRALKICPVRVS